MLWSHHAYLLIGSQAIWRERLAGDWPGDRLEQAVETYGIDEARQLRAWQARVSSEARWFIISFSAITPEAQNALLKTLEEPASGNHFFLITESSELLLPTLLSRLQILSLNKTEPSQDPEWSKWAQQFLTADYESRLALVAAVLQDEAASPKAQGLKAITALTNTLLTDPKRAAKTTEALLWANNYIHDQAALPKMILEHLALVLPLW